MAAVNVWTKLPGRLRLSAARTATGCRRKLPLLDFGADVRRGDADSCEAKCSLPGGRGALGHEHSVNRSQVLCAIILFFKSFRSLGNLARCAQKLFSIVRAMLKLLQR